MPRRMLRCLRRAATSKRRAKKDVSTDFYFEIDAANVGDSNRTADRSRPAFAIPILLVRAARKSACPFAARRKFSLPRALNHSSLNSSSRRFGARFDFLV